MSGAVHELNITRAIVETFMRDLLDWAELDVAIVGAGPSGLTAARLLAEQGLKTAVFERYLHVGGGMWGGGMLMPRIVVQAPAHELLEQIGVKLQAWRDDLFVADAVEAVNKCAAAALDAGARIFVGIACEDVVVREGGRVAGLVLNWYAVQLAQLHVDPLAISSRVVIDATGHDAEVCRIVQRKVHGSSFPTPSGQVLGESSMWAERGEAALVENTREVYPGLIVAGMAANALFGGHRMGAIFGGMFLSGKRAAEIAADLARKYQPA